MTPVAFVGRSRPEAGMADIYEVIYCRVKRSAVNALTY